MPLKAIPKKHHAAFRPIIKKNPLVAINVDGKLYKPVDQKNVKPVDKNGVTYLPVKEVKNPKKITNPIKNHKVFKGLVRKRLFRLSGPHIESRKIGIQ